VQQPIQPVQVQQVPNAILPPVVQQPTVQPNIPVMSSVETFTIDQISKAMATAMDCGKEDVIQNILNIFKASSLMEIDQSNYNKIASILREAGVQV